MFEFLTIEVILSAFNLYASDKGRHTVFFTQLNSLGGDSDEEEPFRNCTTKVIGNEIKMPFTQKIIPSTRSRIAILADEVIRNHCTQSCASRVHPQELFLKTEIEYCSKDSQLHDVRQKSH